MLKLSALALLATVATALGVVVAEREAGGPEPLEAAVEADPRPRSAPAELEPAPALAPEAEPETLEIPAVETEDEYVAGKRAFDEAPFAREPYTWVDDRAGVVRIKQLLTVRFPDGTERDYPATSTATPVHMPRESIVKDGRSVVEKGFDVDLRGVDGAGESR